MVQTLFGKDIAFSVRTFRFTDGQSSTDDQNQTITCELYLEPADQVSPEQASESDFGTTDAGQIYLNLPLVEVVAVVVVVIELRLNEINPVTNIYIKLAIAYAKKPDKNITNDDNEKRRTKEILGHKEVSVLIDILVSSINSF